MIGETNLEVLLKTMKPFLNAGDYVYCTTTSKVNIEDVIMSFVENEGTTVILTKEKADLLEFPYSFIAAWITITAHSSLAASGFTAAFSAALAKENISCNVIAAFYHDHIFVDKKDAEKAMKVLKDLRLSFS
jgi:uncharacterized protein